MPTAKNMVATALAVTLALSVQPASAQRLSKPSGTQRTQEATMSDVPRCTRKLGTVSVMDGDDPSGWTQFQLTGPQKLIKVLLQPGRSRIGAQRRATRAGH